MGSLTHLLWAFCLSTIVLLGALAAAAGEPVIRVCVRDPRVPPSVDQWVYAPSGTLLVTRDAGEFQAKSTGLMRFAYDPAAPESNNRFLPIPYNKLECPERVLPVKPKDPPPPAREGRGRRGGGRRARARGQEGREEGGGAPTAG
jgi:hypothetical protein